MPILYIAFAPILLITLYKRVSSLIVASKESNYGKIKVEILFLSLVVIVSAFIVFNIESIGK